MKLFKYIAYTTLILATISSVYIMLMILEPVDFFEVKQPMLVDKGLYKVDDIVKYKIDYCKTRNYEVVGFESSLVGDYIYKLPTQNNIGTILPLGCQIITSEVPLNIPANVDTGIYRIVVTVTYKMNAIKKEIKQFSTEEFLLTKYENN